MKIKSVLCSLFFFVVCGDLFAQWKQVVSIDSLNISSIATNGANVFAGTGKGLIIRSTDNGDSWEAILDFSATGDTTRVGPIAVSATNVFAGFDKGIYLSRDNGINWRQAISISSNALTLSADGENVYAGTSTGLYQSTNKGTTWKQLLDNKTVISSFGISNPNIYVGVLGGVFISSNGGVNWKQILTLKDSVTAMVLSGTNIFVGTKLGNVFLSKNRGSSWSSVNAGVVFSSIYSVAVSGDNIYVATEYGNVYVSSDFGKSWGMESDNLIFQKVTALALNDQFVFVGTAAKGIWKRKISDLLTIITSVNDLSIVPSKYQLEQNYPNPFNPITTINFSIPEASYVTIKVYDALGREVTTLVEKTLDAGYHSVNFYASKLHSGAYIYAIQTGDFRATKKMIFMK